MKVVGIFGVVFQLNLASILGKSVEERSSSYPDGPRGPDFAKSPGALKVDLLEGGMKYWYIEEHWSHSVNDEVEAYTRGAVKQDESTKAITLTAHKSGSYVSSGRINTNHRWNTGDSESTKRHGYLEVRAKFPAKSDHAEFTGAWPAVWMLGSQGGWPQEGEIDIMESVNGIPDIYMSLHSTNHHGGSPQHPSGPIKANTDFSKYGAILGLEWNIQESAAQLDLTWWISYFDLGSQMWRTEHHTKSLHRGTGDDYEVFYNSFINHKGFYAIINLAQGGVWPGCRYHTCVLKSGDQHVIVESAKVYGISKPDDNNPTEQPPHPDQNCFEKDTDYHGSDLENGHYVSTESAGACQTSCQNTAGCEFWTWTPNYHNACWRKSGKGDVRSHYGVTSGPKHC